MRYAKSIGRAELEILHYVQDHPSVSVREVADHFGHTKGHVRTTILNVMERLRKKGHLSRRKVEGVFRYDACVPKADLLRNLVRDFVERTLGGSVTPFLAYLVREANVTDQELNELRQLVLELEQKEQKP